MGYLLASGDKTFIVFSLGYLYLSKNCSHTKQEKVLLVVGADRQTR